MVKIPLKTIDRKAVLYKLKTIHSPDNKIYKECSRLNMKKHRDKTGEYLIEGWNLIHEAAAENCVIKYIIISEEMQFSKLLEEMHFHKKSEQQHGISEKDQLDVFEKKMSGVSENSDRISETSSKHRFSEVSDEIIRIFSDKLAPDDIVFMKGSLYNKVALTETSQGIMAVVKKQIHDRKRFACETCKEGTNIVVLDRLQDPGNIGTIIRTADAAGYAGILAIKGTGDVYSPKVVRAAAGSLFRIPVLYVENEWEAIEFAAETSKTVLVTCFEDAVDYREVDMARNIALVIGNEGNGVSQTFIRAAGKRVKIPMKAPVDSLNAAVAAGVLMYHSLE